MRRARIALAAASGASRAMWLAAGFGAACSHPPEEAFVVDGFADAPVPTDASVIGLWTIPSADPVRYYKLGDGIRAMRRFTLGFDTDPPAEALGADGVGVAIVVMLPPFTTVPDGPVDPAAIGILGVSSDTAIVYKRADATGPAWSTALPLRFSCVQCVRNPNGLDSFELIGCGSVLIEGVGAQTCQWY